MLASCLAVVQRSRTSADRVGLVGALVAGVALVGACGTEDLGSRSSADVSSFGLVPCSDPDDAVAAFVASDQGFGSPGRVPESPLGGDIWLMTADGHIKALTDDARSSQPWFAADGKRLYFTKSENGVEAGAIAPGQEVWEWNAETGTQRPVSQATDGQLATVGNPEASPDGSQVVFEGWPIDSTALVVVDLSSGKHEVLPAPVPVEAYHGQIVPTWSPDGRAVAYVYYEVEELTGTMWSSIRVIDVESGDESIPYAPDDPVRIMDLEWTPDGSTFVIAELSGSGTTSGTIATVDVATGVRTELFDHGPIEFALARRDGTAVSGFAAVMLDPTLEPVFTTWDATEVSEEGFATHLSFAVDLTIAECALPQ